MTLFDLIPSLPVSVFGFILFLLAIFIGNRFWIWYRLHHIPGPFWAGLSMWWMLKNTMVGRMHLALYEVCDEYGMTVFAALASGCLRLVKLQTDVHRIIGSHWSQRAGNEQPRHCSQDLGRTLTLQTRSLLRCHQIRSGQGQFIVHAQRKGSH